MTLSDYRPAVLENVHKRFTRRGPWVLDGVNMDFEPGTVTVVTGANGSGKSTLLRIAARLTRPTKGAVWAATTMNYVPEHQPESVRMTGTAYLGHVGRMRGLGSEETRARSADLLNRLGLEPGPHVPVQELSKGNRQKVLLAQAFMAPVRLLVLDEPFSGLDDRAQRAVVALISDARHKGTAAVASVHGIDRSLVVDRTVRLDNGKIVDLAPSSEAVWHESPMVSVVLVDRSGTLDRNAVAARPGVTRTETARDEMVLTVQIKADSSDQFLFDAISAGWSIVSVAPTDRRTSPEVDS